MLSDFLQTKTNYISLRLRDNKTKLPSAPRVLGSGAVKLGSLTLAAWGRGVASFLALSESLASPDPRLYMFYGLSGGPDRLGLRTSSQASPGGGAVYWNACVEG